MAAITLLWPGSVLDRMWETTPDSYGEMAPYRVTIGILFLVLSQVFVITTRGWFKQRKWGWLCVIGIFAANATGDLMRLFSGDFTGGLLGLCIAGFIIFYLTRPRIKGLFK
ncbi:MAG: hypothetical protein M0D57_11920 [Sphingobacteriales bacterium JAD_PAG50586_3]|nr:MAG: hypothetical protein M0D57_11920 [Sphingobacteriales bacterium JAD_PAG50586_3]